MAYGDQPAAICELVDWVHASGFELVAAGKGMNCAPPYRYSTPDTVWGIFGWTDEEVAAGDFNPKMYNSFTDGTKAAIGMAAVANATGLDCPDDGLAFPPSGLHDLAQVFKLESEGGRLARPGLVDIASSREPDGRVVLNDIQYGMFVTFRAPDEYTRAGFQQNGLLTDTSGWYASMWRPFHLIGLETSVSVLNAALRGEATGTSSRYGADTRTQASTKLERSAARVSGRRPVTEPARLPPWVPMSAVEKHIEGDAVVQVFARVDLAAQIHPPSPRHGRGSAASARRTHRRLHHGPGGRADGLALEMGRARRCPGRRWCVRRAARRF